MTNSSVLSNTATSCGNYGGGIFNSGVLVLDNTQVGNNSGFNSGGIASINAGVVLRNGSSVFNNAATGPVSSGGGEGGGILSPGVTGTVRVDSSSVTLSGNSALYGGAIDNRAGAQLWLSDSLIDSNYTAGGAAGTGYGGGIFNDGRLRVRNVTLSNNNALNGSGDGGGLFNSGTAEARNTLLGGNIDKGGRAPDCNSLTSQGYTLVQNTTGCALPGFGTLTVTGSTLSGNSAIDAGELGGSKNENGATLTVGQRGYARP